MMLVLLSEGSEQWTRKAGERRCYPELQENSLQERKEGEKEERKRGSEEAGGLWKYAQAAPKLSFQSAPRVEKQGVLFIIPKTCEPPTSTKKRSVK